VVRARLLCNQVLEDLLDIIISCYCPNKVSREATPALRGHNYLVPGAVTNWANEEIAQDQLPGGSFDPGARRPEPRANPGPADGASEPQEGDDFDALLVALSSTSWDVPGTEDGRSAGLGCCHPPVQREVNPSRNIYHSPSNR